MSDLPGSNPAFSRGSQLVSFFDKNIFTRTSKLTKKPIYHDVLCTMVLSLHLLWCIIKGYIFDAGNVFIEKLYTEIFSMTCNRMSSIYTLRTSTITVYYTSSNVHHSVVKSYCCTTLYQIRILIKYIQSTFTRQQGHFRHSNAQLCYGSGFSM